MNILEKLEQRGLVKRGINTVEIKFEMPLYEDEIVGAITDKNIVQILKVRVLTQFFNAIGLCDYSLLDTQEGGQS